MEVVATLGGKLPPLDTIEFHEKLPQMAFRLLLSVDPQNYQSDIGSQSQWSIFEDLYSMIGKIPLPEGYPVLTRSKGAWKARSKTIRDAIEPFHLNSIGKCIMDGLNLSQLRYIYTQNKILPMLKQQKGKSEPTEKPKPSVQSTSEQDSFLRITNPRVLCEEPFDQPVKQSRSTLILQLLKFVVAQHDYRPEESYVSIYDFVLAMALQAGFKIHFIVEDYKPPAALAHYNYKENFPFSQLEEFYELLKSSYRGQHPSDIEYILKTNRLHTQIKPPGPAEL